jgi:hypothetical protein
LRDPVTRPGRAAALAGAALIAALAAACQPLPHPFEDDRPPAALLKVRDTASVSVAPVEGGPAGIAAKLGGAVAGALLRRDIPATDKTTSLGSYPLYGRLVQSRPRDGKLTVTALWRLYDARGGMIGERSAKFDAKTAEWEGDRDKAVERLAGLSAEALAPLLQEEAAKPPVAAAAIDAVAPPPDERRLKVAVGKVSGAPGDGGKALANAVAAVLKRQELRIVDAGGKPDLFVECEVALTPAKPDKQHIKILWRVRRADGVEIGTVGQENDVPQGLLDGPWGDLAYTVALAAREGLMQLVARGAPEGKT